MSPLRIVIVDDHAVVRRGVRALLESQPGWEVAGEAVTGREAVELAKRLYPDIVVMDLSLPELNGLDAARQILKDITGADRVHIFDHTVRRRVAGSGRADKGRRPGRSA